MAEKITFPVGIRVLISVMVAEGWGFIKELHTNGEETKLARRFVCPHCLEHWTKAGKKGMLARRLSQNSTVFVKGSRKVAVCHVCGFRKFAGSEDVATPACSCGNPLPRGRKKWCYDCRPAAGHVQDMFQ